MGLRNFCSMVAKLPKWVRASSLRMMLFFIQAIAPVFCVFYFICNERCPEVKKYISEDELTAMINQLNIKSSVDTSSRQSIREDSKLYNEEDNDLHGTIQVKEQQII